MAPRRKALVATWVSSMAVKMTTGMAGIVGGDLVEQAEAVGAGHDDVGEDEIVVGVLLQTVEGLFGAFGGGGGVAAMFEQGGDDVAHRGFIVDDQDSFLRHE